MWRYILRRVLLMIPVFFGATFLIYAAVFALPGDPVRALFGERPVPESVLIEIREQYNLNDPLLLQYAKYMGNVFQGDLGIDFRGRPVTDIIVNAFPVTLRLGLTAFAFLAVIGLTAGVLAAIWRGSFIDNLVRISTILLVAVPIFVLGYTAQLLFGVELGWFPVAGDREGWYSYLLPGLVLAAGELAYVSRLTRTSLVENLRADYVRTATAKGLSRERVVGRHALRNSLIPVVTYLGITIGTLMIGAIVTEGIFNLPGIGRATFDAVQNQDNAVVVGIVTLLVIIFMVVNLLVDILYAVLDPRIRYD
jgi:ABC-type dipeptide/oligopeptide/nickel transport system permease component